MSNQIEIGNHKLLIKKATNAFVLEIESKRFREAITPKPPANLDPDDEKSVDEATELASKAWSAFCKRVFTKSWWWRLKGLPHWLKYENLIVGEANEVLESFFTWYTEVTKVLGGKKTSNTSSEK